MKKTLFLALALVTLPAAHADFGYELGKVDGKTVGGNTLVGEAVLTPENLPSLNNAVLSVGTHNGDASMELTEGTTLTLPNALMIGGTGYGITDKVSGNGKVVVKQGATINVGSKTTSSGGHHVDVGNSRLPALGELYVEGGTVNAAQFVVGAGKGTGLAVISDGGSVNLANAGITGGQIGMLVGYHNGYGDNGKGTLILDNGTLTDSLNHYAFVGCSGDAAVKLLNGSTWESDSGVYMGDIWEGAYGEGTETDTLFVSNDSSFRASFLWADDKSAVNNEGEMTLKGTLLYGAELSNSGQLNTTYIEMEESSMSNSGTINASSAVSIAEGSLNNSGALGATGVSLSGSEAVNSGTMTVTGGLIELYEGAALDNIAGTIAADAVVLGAGSTFTTGVVTVSGCESEMAQTHSMSAAYATGLADGTAVVLDPDKVGSSVTIGALLTGGDTMQHLYTEDFRALETKVRETLALQFATDYDAKTQSVTAWEPFAGEYLAECEVKVANIIGKNIAANVTTDDVGEGGDVTVAIEGATLVVRVGTDGADIPTEDDKRRSAEKVGTLGSYTTDVTETDAAVRLHTETANTAVEWQGHYMETVAQENATIGATTKVTIGTKDEETGEPVISGSLTVVETSTLHNQGQVSTDNVIVDGTLNNNGLIAAATEVNGTLKGSGTISGDTVLNNGAELIVGNSPGHSTFEAALIANGGSSITFSVAGTNIGDASTGDNTGWDSGTYSQIVITGSEPITLSSDVTINVDFGGSSLFTKTTPLYEQQAIAFELMLIKGGVDASLDLDNLLAHTTLGLTNEVGGNPDALTGLEWTVSFSDTSYRIEGNNLILSGTMNTTATPEPATTTLSLLALAALCARRRR